MNRSTIYEFLQKDTELEYASTVISNRKYMVFRCPWKWEESYLLINKSRITNFQSVILFSNELVVRFGITDDRQVNIPYKDIDYLEVRNDLDIGYSYLYQDKKKYH